MNTHRDALLSFFPTAEAGETVYSLLSRYHLLSGHRSFKQSTLELFNQPGTQAAAEFPSYLSELSNKTGISLNILVEDMTGIHYYKPFLSADRYCELRACLCDGNTAHLQSWIGSVANRTTSGNQLHFCPVCASQDITLFGYPIWHLEHQLPGVVSCPDHHEILRHRQKLRKKVVLPNSGESMKSTLEEDNYSNLVIEEFRYSSDHLDPGRVLNTYKRRLNDLGLLTGKGHIRLAGLRELLIKNITKMKRHEIYRTIFNGLNKHQYPECLFYSPHACHHPLKHLILINELFGAWSNFLFYYCAVRHLSKKCSNNCSRVKHEPIAEKKRIALDYLQKGYSLRCTSKVSGLSVTTLRVLADQHRVPVKTRPHKVSRFIERSIWRKLFIGESTEDIAQQFDISVGSVELILRKHQYLIPLRQKIRFFRKLAICRKELAGYMASNPDSNRNTIKSQKRTAYMWLYHNDNSWLYNQLPPKAVAICWRKKHQLHS